MVALSGILTLDKGGTGVGTIDCWLKEGDDWCFGAGGAEARRLRGGESWGLGMAREAANVPVSIVESKEKSPIDEMRLSMGGAVDRLW